MALIKTIASYRKEDGTWEPQRDVEMHPLEEKEIKAHWAIHDVNIKIPEKPTKEQEHEWLIENGADFVKLKREEWKKAYDVIEPELIAAHNYHQECTKEWHAHVEHCVANGFDCDTYDKEKYDAIS